MTFRATFVGHQGWMYRSGDTVLLVDPLLTEDFGIGGLVGNLYPPRELELEAWPRVSAVLLTHEHEDHFDIPTLHRLDRGIPILLSARASTAAREILGEMGFTVTLVSAGTNVVVGDLELVLFSPEPMGETSNEWDVLQYLIRDRANNGSMFSAVDTAPSRESYDFLQSHGSVSLIAWANNFTNFSIMGAYAVSPVLEPASLQHVFTDEVRKRRQTGSAPLAYALNGGGFSVGEDRAWQNEHVFPLRSETMRDAAVKETGEKIYAPLPGDTFVLEQGKLQETLEPSKFLRAAPEATWPPHEAIAEPPSRTDYGPASGRPDLSDEELEELSEALPELAQYLYGGNAYRHLYGLPRGELEGRRAALALVLMADAEGGSYVFEYVPQGCRFEMVECEDPVAEYAFGIECWANDLLDLFRGKLAASALVFGRCRGWNHTRGTLAKNLEPGPLIFEFFHPLRRTDAFLAHYRGLFAEQPAEVTRVKSTTPVSIRSYPRPAWRAP